MPVTMTTESLRQRHPLAPTAEKIVDDIKSTVRPEHPAGAIKHGMFNQALRLGLCILYFNTCCLAIVFTQLIGAPLYWYDKNLFYAWMAMTKQHFGIALTTLTYWWAPAKMVVCGDESVRGQLRKTEDGRLECDFPERLILIANHQIYTDWIYLWWISYTSNMHGHIYIILKESIKYIPLIGTGMMFYGFIFLSRKWAKDKERFQYRLRKLNSSHSGPMSGTHTLDPMWLLIFPEGTNLSANGRKSSKAWADKNNIEDARHVMLPRSTGLHYCLAELRPTTEWMYDCTVAYEGIPVGEYGQDIFTIKSSYLEGRPPKSIHIHWRRFATKDIPTDEKAFSDWLLKRWREKDDLMEYFHQHNRFPADDYIETQVTPKNPLEFLNIFVPLGALALVLNVIGKMWDIVLHTLRIR
ncbi:acyltransferase-domain-containing protein [Westerdykella ornata]|uniref:Acyltransferase-domain-containing protein n=1 Tax=Westerdykella ornata TaxID=318751 RepID=A0A6A6JBQ3_WESOR|nr:acyltransferase-domain-containing protein [Westerdykella ornata]KAF2273862.1 acyltransferase-domain-containing protein [Westerdykella ornata]